MSPWTKSMSLVAGTLCCSMTFATTNARAEASEETAESTDSIVEPSNDDATHRVDLIDPNEHRRGYGNCYSYCDNLHARCLRSYIGRGEHRDDRETYRRCERRLDYCVAVCRGPVLYGR